MADSLHNGRIRVGIGGWSYEPWRETFYPKDVSKKDELRYASRQVTAIEVNSTFYGLQKPHVFANWRDATPDSFMFSLKAPRFVAQRKVLAQARPSIERFIGSGIVELRSKLGPILWQLEPKQAFSAADLRGFLELLPRAVDGLPLRHALEVRHESFRCAEFVALAQEHGVAVVYVDDAEYPAIAALTADFAYARLRRCVADEPTGYDAAAMAKWLEHARAWSRGEQPANLTQLGGVVNAGPRDVFVYFINGAKERAPAAAQALLAAIGTPG